MKVSQDRDMDRVIRIARGEQPADLVICGCQLVNVLTGEIYPTDIAIADGRIVGLGPYEGRQIFNANGAYATPGFIDAHLHVESSCLTVREFARAVVPMGTTAVITDPHEIANVLGLAGITYMLDSSKGLPLDVFVMLPSCVPATKWETSGARLEAQDLRPLFNHPQVLGLAEMMNYPAVLNRDPSVLQKMALEPDEFIDGHAPGLTGRDLCAYIGTGVRSDHECTSFEEAKEKLRLGMYVLIREGSVAKNLDALLSLITPSHASRLGLITDDRHPADLLNQGHVNGLLKKAVAGGVSPTVAIQMVTINPATFYSLNGLGAIAPGYRANMVLLEDLKDFEVLSVWKEGQLVAEKGQLTVELPQAPRIPASSMKIGWNQFQGLDISAGEPEIRMGRVIDIVPDQLVTQEIVRKLTLRNGVVCADPEHDLAKLAVVERHKATGNVGLGMVHGLGLRRGALASSVAHDSHNIVVAGTNDHDMLAAIKFVDHLQGGLVVVDDGVILASLPLPIAGLLSDLSLNEVAHLMEGVTSAARRLGSSLTNPFMMLSFLALPVIPELKLTDRGLFNVLDSKFVSLFVADNPH
ncbi:MAG: adenine deaminase [Nitrospirota bacterium]|nr:MAG: adenine deaminase [Nitrospirota bacterium]